MGKIILLARAAAGVAPLAAAGEAAARAPGLHAFVIRPSRRQMAEAARFDPGTFAAGEGCARRRGGIGRSWPAAGAR
ncbi:hypothetical protein GCM10010964_29940 [Caldovatus sediminis]|uniref:Uncharacterized protein n=1 Tax=Caldovatus sediminis TaxID=2041189 RepID=A0A8J2ZD54_9PROT|nr:hypothetical protein [Caldovatus sediminis]GGG40353.1 hypothetical protein GCM10010964_29940 [Caldovatus sediminis]